MSRFVRRCHRRLYSAANLSVLLLYCRFAAIGVTGFEPAASCSQSRRSAKLSYTPWETSKRRNVGTSKRWNVKSHGRRSAVECHPSSLGRSAVSWAAVYAHIIPPDVTIGRSAADDAEIDQDGQDHGQEIDSAH